MASSLRCQLNLVSSRGCFVAMPPTWAHRLHDTPTETAHIFTLSWSATEADGADGEAWVSWAGAASTAALPGSVSSRGMLGGADAAAEPQGVVELDPLFAKGLGLVNGQSVTVQATTIGIPLCQTVHVEPVAASDWEIVELNAGLVEHVLCSQVRVVWVGLVVPIWLGNACAQLRVTAIDPDLHSPSPTPPPCWLIPLDGEVSVAPKVRDVGPTGKDDEVSTDTLPKGVSVDTQIRTAADNSVLPTEIWVNYWSPAFVQLPTTCTPVVWVEGLASGIGQAKGDDDNGHPATVEPTSRSASDADTAYLDEPLGQIVLRMKHVPELPHSHAFVHPEVLGLLRLTPYTRVRITSITERSAQTRRAVLHPIQRSHSSSADGHDNADLEAWLANIPRRSPLRVVHCGLVSVGTRVCRVTFPDHFSGRGAHSRVEGDPTHLSETDSEIDRRSFCALYDGCGVVVENGPSVTSVERHGTTNPTWACGHMQPVIGGMGEQLHKLEQLLLYGTSSASSNIAQQRAFGILVTGPNGTGKTTLVAHACAFVQKRALAHVTVLNCSTVAQRKVESVLSVLNETFALALRSEPAVVVLDELDHLIPPSVENGGDGSRQSQVAEGLRKVCSAMLGRRVVIVGIALSRESVHATVNETWVFENSIALKVPSAEERFDILQAQVQSTGYAALADDSPLHSFVTAVDKMGYVARDLQALLIRAHHQAIIDDTATGEVDLQSEWCCEPRDPTASDAPIPLKLAHFVSAVAGFTPASLRGVKLQEVEVGLDKVGAMNDVKSVLLETMLWPSKYPGLFSASSLRLRSGVLLYGPPGCGKTLIAGAAAKHCNLRFISIAGPQLLSKYIGASEQAVRDVFDRAQAAKPSVLFFDEFDSIAPRRGHDSTGVTDRVVNQLLTQLDGVEGLDGVFVVAATSRPELIDPALLRPGRLDNLVFCGVPSTSERADILRTLCTGLDLAPEVNLEAIADRCDGYTGADLKGVVGAAQLEAAHESLQSVLPQPSNDDGDKISSDRANPPPFAIVGGPSPGDPLSSAEIARLEKIVGVSETRKVKPGKTHLESPSRGVITMTHFKEALQSVGRSVTDQDLEHFLRVHAELCGGSAPNPVPGQRSTLA